MSSPRSDLRRGLVEPIVLMISRREVEAGDVNGVVDRLNEQFRTPEFIWRFRCQMSLVVAGYEDDWRELIDIPEVRSFLREFDQAWPYWAFFFNQLDDSIALLCACLCGSFYPGGGAVEIDAGRLGQLLARGFAAMNALFDDHGFPESELETMSRGVIEVIEYAGMSAPRER